MEEQNLEEKAPATWILYAAGFGVFLAWVAFGLGAWFYFGETKSGVFGDTFGAVNALFSGLALAGLIYTIYLQRKELAFQRLELQATREELRRSAAAQENSEEALREQVEATTLNQRITALNNMLNYAEKCQAHKLSGDPISMYDRSHVDRWARRKEALLTELDILYNELFKRSGSRSQSE